MLISVIPRSTKNQDSPISVSEGPKEEHSVFLITV